MQIVRGIGASPGIAIGGVFLIQAEDLRYKTRSELTPLQEWQRAQNALDTAVSQLEHIKVHSQTQVGETQAMIFEAQADMLKDPELRASIYHHIFEEKVSAESAVMTSAEHFAQQLATLKDEYLGSRADDVRDVARRCLRILLGKPQTQWTLDKPAIIIARDLTPSETVQLDKSLLLGFCTAEGGATSHTAILAKALGIPAVVGAGDAILNLQTHDTIILDGHDGLVIVAPDEPTLLRYQHLQEENLSRAANELSQASQPAVTHDGIHIEIAANVGNLSDARKAIEYGAEGIGLLRTEFLYLDRQTEPDEEEQYLAYRAIFDEMGDRPIVIRTLDVGGDKELPYINLGKEENPFLGWRAIRMCLDTPALFKTQLRAILRAAVGHDVRLMFPMVAALPEIRQARALLEESRRELLAANIPVGEKIQVGMMIEIPAAALMADKFAPEVDFFSIGTNDLTQYTLAAERTNKRVAHLSNALDPSVLRLIDRVVREGHKAGIWVGVCGEMAGDAHALPVLLGLGVDELSMSPALIPHAKAVIRASRADVCKRLAHAALEAATYADVMQLLETYAPDQTPAKA
ncbi:MAG: phosphoenolpyruvate--protein phosphotransferase [Anaerolineales bacterium]